MKKKEYFQQHPTVLRRNNIIQRLTIVFAIAASATLAAGNTVAEYKLPILITGFIFLAAMFATIISYNANNSRKLIEKKINQEKKTYQLCMDCLESIQNDTISSRQNDTISSSLGNLVCQSGMNDKKMMIVIFYLKSYWLFPHPGERVQWENKNYHQIIGESFKKLIQEFRKTGSWNENCSQLQNEIKREIEEEKEKFLEKNKKNLAEQMEIINHLE